MGQPKRLARHPWMNRGRKRSSNCWFPLKINRFAVHNGEIHYRDFSRNPKVNLSLDRVQTVATNLTNSKKLSKSLIADIRIEGRPLGVGDARSQISLDPYAAKPTFAFNPRGQRRAAGEIERFLQSLRQFHFRHWNSQGRNGGKREGRRL